MIIFHFLVQNKKDKTFQNAERDKKNTDLERRLNQRRNIDNMLLGSGQKLGTVYFNEVST